ncbi:MAG: UvrB/UvrC motif-containing protein [Clostridia bacterium]|nr:UvrB/UvrC motif-containing protein [Clostridia bacterium]
MVCSECNINEATVHITKIINGIKKEMHICSECAKKIENLGGFKFVNDSDIFFPIFNYGLEETKPKGKACSFCDGTLADFNNSGYLGCPNCYNEFAEYLSPVIKRVQRDVKHIGKIPNDDGELFSAREYERLSKELKAAVAEERYEDAAAIRDKMRKLK